MVIKDKTQKKMSLETWGAWVVTGHRSLQQEARRPWRRVSTSLCHWNSWKALFCCLLVLSQTSGEKLLGKKEASLTWGTRFVPLCVPLYLSHLKPAWFLFLSFVQSQRPLSVQVFTYHLSWINSQDLSRTNINRLVVRVAHRNLVPGVLQHWVIVPEMVWGL